MFELPASLSFFFCNNLTLTAGFIKIQPRYHILVAESTFCSLTFFSDLMHSFKEKSDTKQFFSDKVKQIQKRFPTTMKVNINKLNDLPK